jgi:predicted RNase H-like HicB family nuclease
MPRLHYSIILQWDPRDAIYVVTVPELPGCMTHGRTYEEALRMGLDAIEGWIETQHASGRPVPPPRTYAESTATAGSA